tara:strand:- start:54 stop:422 length:369 start_codon:yes stop_codon:yes gene_type:complete
MISIYKIVDNTNGNIYVGSTERKLNLRLSEHKSHAKSEKTRSCSSELINFNNCYIELIEECDSSMRIEREQYYLDNLTCVNKQRAIVNKKEYNKKRSHWKFSFSETTRDVCNIFYISDSLFD